MEGGVAVRHSGYELVPGDLYCTPAWVTEALLEVEKFPGQVLEPASGELDIVKVLCAAGYGGTSYDISSGPEYDFLKAEIDDCQSIITNPPYSNGLAEKFVRHALDLTEPVRGKVAMLLPLAWDSAKSRSDLFKEHPAFKAKYTLTRRIRWENLEQKKNGPSQNHAWYVWCWKNATQPICGYLPAGGGE